MRKYNVDEMRDIFEKVGDCKYFCESPSPFLCLFTDFFIETDFDKFTVNDICTLSTSFFRDIRNGYKEKIVFSDDVCEWKDKVVEVLDCLVKNDILPQGGISLNINETLDFDKYSNYMYHKLLMSQIDCSKDEHFVKRFDEENVVFWFDYRDNNNYDKFIDNLDGIDFVSDIYVEKEDNIIKV